MNRVIVPARQATQAGGIHSLALIPGLHIRLKIRALNRSQPDRYSNTRQGIFYYIQGLVTNFSGWAQKGPETDPVLTGTTLLGRESSIIFRVQLHHLVDGLRQDLKQVPSRQVRHSQSRICSIILWELFIVYSNSWTRTGHGTDSDQTVTPLLFSYSTGIFHLL